MKFHHLKEWVEFWKTSAQLERTKDDQEEWVNNGSVDVRGRPVIRRKTGGWKAALFILVADFTEKLAFFGILADLIIYLTTVLNEGVETSVKNVNYWMGVTYLLPLIGGFIADTYCGRYWMVIISSIIYLSGLILLTLSVSLSALKPADQCESGICSKATTTQIGVFFLSLYIIALGVGGYKPSLQAFGADQFDEEDKTESLKKSSFFNFWYFSDCSGLLLAVTVIAYVQENVSWGFGFGTVTVVMGIATVLFLYGTPFYRHKPLPGGSPIARLAQVVVCAIRKRNISMLSDLTLLYEIQESDTIKLDQRQLSHTNNFRYLDKAAIMVQDTSEWSPDSMGSTKPNPWKVCTVTQVEETKLILRMVPVWVSCLISGMVTTQSTAFFIKQGSTMDRSMGSRFRVPPASLLAFSNICGLVFVIIYDRCIVPLAKRITGNERGVTVLQRIGIGMFFSVLCMVTGALTEKKRIHVAKTHGLLDNQRSTIPLSVFWLAPQFSLMGIADVFTLVGLQEYFYDQVPDSMRSMGIAFSVSVMGVASFLNSALVTIVDRVSKGGGHPGWLQHNLNRCRLDYFYWLFTIMSIINLCGYVYASHAYTYKKLK